MLEKAGQKLYYFFIYLICKIGISIYGIWAELVCEVLGEFSAFSTLLMAVRFGRLSGGIQVFFGFIARTNCARLLDSQN